MTSTYNVQNETTITFSGGSRIEAHECAVSIDSNSMQWKLLPPFTKLSDSDVTQKIVQFYKKL